MKRALRALAAVAAASLALAGGPAGAGQSEAFVGGVTERLTGFLPALSAPEDRFNAARSLLGDSLDMAGLAAFVMGPDATQATPERRDAFVAMLQDVLARAVARGAPSYRDVNVRFLEARPHGEGLEMVRTEASKPGMKPVGVDWIVSTDAEPRIVDVVVAGLSVRVLLRAAAGAGAAENGGGIDGLTLFLEGLTGSAAAP